MGSFLDSWNDVHKRVVLFSGVFDPVHKGHITLAQEAYKLHGGTVVMLPERVPQHKHGSTPYKHRLKMLNIATSDIPEIRVLDYPADNHWILETFTWLGEKFPDRKFTWLVGSDVVGGVASWPNAEILKELRVDLILVANRRDDNYQLPPERSIHGVDLHAMNSKYRYMESSFIRKDLHTRHTSLPDGVYNYINDHDLYQKES